MKASNTIPVRMSKGLKTNNPRLEHPDRGKDLVCADNDDHGGG